MSYLETCDRVLKCSICELLCWYCMVILCVVELACGDSTGKPNTEKQETAMPYLNLTWTWGLTLLWSLTNTAAASTRHHRKFNEPLVMCGLFIDGHHQGWASPSEVKTTLYYLGALELYHLIQQLGTTENPLEAKESWVKAHFILDREKDKVTFPTISYRKEWNKSLWTNDILFEI